MPLFDDLGYKMAGYIRDKIQEMDRFLGLLSRKPFPLGEETHPHSLVITYWDHGGWGLIK